jgi:hypothetical protein
MCGPAAAAVGISAISAIGGYRSSKKQAKAQDAAVGRQEEQDRLAFAEQARQEDEAAIEEMSERAREARRERGRLSAIAADTGLGGISQELLLRQSRFNEGYDTTTIDANRDRVKRQIEHGVSASSARAQLQRASIERPSLLGAGLQIAGTATRYWKPLTKELGIR